MSSYSGEGGEPTGDGGSGSGSGGPLPPSPGGWPAEPGPMLPGGGSPAPEWQPGPAPSGQAPPAGPGGPGGYGLAAETGAGAAAGQGYGSPPAQAYPGGPLEPAPAGTAGSGAPRGKAHGLLALAIVLAVLIVAGAVTAGVVLTSSSSKKGGSASPQDAVQSLFDAANTMDVNAALDDIDPAERADIGPGFQQVWDQLKRLGILSKNADLNHITGLSVQIPPARYTVTSLSSTLSEVVATSNQKVRSVAHLQQLPVGPTLKQFIGPELTRDVPAQSSSFGRVRLGTVKVGGHWYVSIGYTIAINDFVSSGTNPAPEPAADQPALSGASSPTNVVNNIISGFQHRDLSAVLSQFDPAELGVAMAYSNRWLPKAQSALDRGMAALNPKIKAAGFKVQSYDLDLQTKSVALGTLVTAGPNFSFSASGKGVSVDFSHGCLTETVGAKTQKTCSGTGTSKLSKYMPAPVRPILQRLEGAAHGSGLLMVNSGGHWYLSLLRTAYQQFVAVLSALEPGDFATVAGNLAGIEAGFGQYAKSVENSLGVTVPTLAAATSGLSNGPFAALFAGPANYGWVTARPSSWLGSPKG